MKKIILILLALLVLFCGCAQEEIIDIRHEENESEIPHSETSAGKENSEDTAGDIVSDEPQPFVVFVTGEVVNPGVYELNSGMRVIDAIDAAGGYTEDAFEEYINLAGLISDEQMIYVPSIEEVSEEDIKKIGELNSYGGSRATSEKTIQVNINTASKEELMTLPGIGESKAEKIITYRNENGPFSSIEGIMQISGIKDGMFNKIKDRICVN